MVAKFSFLSPVISSITDVGRKTGVIWFSEEGVCRPKRSESVSERNTSINACTAGRKIQSSFEEGGLVFHQRRNDEKITLNT
jgi:hypothetical protein